MEMKSGSTDGTTWGSSQVRVSKKYLPQVLGKGSEGAEMAKGPWGRLWDVTCKTSSNNMANLSQSVPSISKGLCWSLKKHLAELLKLNFQWICVPMFLYHPFEYPFQSTSLLKEGNPQFLLCLLPTNWTKRQSRKKPWAGAESRHCFGSFLYPNNSVKAEETLTALRSEYLS